MKDGPTTPWWSIRHDVLRCGFCHRAARGGAMHNKFKPQIGRIVQPTSVRPIVSPIRGSLPPLVAVRRDDLAGITQRLDALSALVQRVSTDVECIKELSRKRRQAKKPGASQLCLDFEG